MSTALTHPAMTREQFLDWAERQEMRYEFDGLAPVAMTGGTNGHNLICQNLWASLRLRLRGSPCRSAGPDAGVATIGDAVRYPDAFITCSPMDPKAKLNPDVVVVFEVISPTSGRIDRLVKLREYAAVPSILHYVLIEGTPAGVTSYHRARGGEPWTVSVATGDEVLVLPEVGIVIPVPELYEGLAQSDAE